MSRPTFDYERVEHTPGNPSGIKCPDCGHINTDLPFYVWAHTTEALHGDCEGCGKRGTITRFLLSKSTP